MPTNFGLVRPKLREVLLELCLFYEQKIDSNKTFSPETLRARLDAELDDKVDEILSLCNEICHTCRAMDRDQPSPSIPIERSMLKLE